MGTPADEVANDFYDDQSANVLLPGATKGDRNLDAVGFTAGSSLYRDPETGRIEGHRPVNHRKHGGLPAGDPRGGLHHLISQTPEWGRYPFVRRGLTEYGQSLGSEASPRNGRTPASLPWGHGYGDRPQAQRHKPVSRFDQTIGALITVRFLERYLPGVPGTTVVPRDHERGWEEYAPRRSNRSAQATHSLDFQYTSVNDKESRSSDLHRVLADDVPEPPALDEVQDELRQDNAEYGRIQALAGVRREVERDRDLRWYEEFLGGGDRSEVERDIGFAACAHPGCEIRILAKPDADLLRALDLPPSPGRPSAYCAVHAAEAKKLKAAERKRRSRASQGPEPRTSDVTPNLPDLPSSTSGDVPNNTKEGEEMAVITIPQRVESLEERMARLEETYRADQLATADAARRVAERIPEDPRIQEAIESLDREWSP